MSSADSRIQNLLIVAMISPVFYHLNMSYPNFSYHIIIPV